MAGSRSADRTALGQRPTVDITPRRTRWGRLVGSAVDDRPGSAVTNQDRRTLGVFFQRVDDGLDMVIKADSVSIRAPVL